MVKETQNKKRRRPPNTGLENSGTEFQLHKSQLFAHSISKELIDFTTFRLLFCIHNASPEEKDILTKLLLDYKGGKVAISWKSGRPVWLNVVSDSRG